MLYIYLKKSATAYIDENILLKDVAQIYDSQKKTTKAFNNISLGKMQGSMTLITCVDIAKAINDDTAQILGEPACAVILKEKKAKGIAYYIKAVFVMLLLFAGGALTIINYHSDVDMPIVHESLSRIFTGSESFSKWISIVYSLGIGAGVLFFANLIPGKKFTPSVFEIEQHNLEQQKEMLQRAQQEEKLKNK